MKSETELILSFEVCGGFTNQRLSILYGSLLAKQIGSKIVLPQLLVNYNDKFNDSVPFHNFYDQSHFKKELKKYKFHFTTNDNHNSNKVYIDLSNIAPKAIPIDLLALKVLDVVKSFQNSKKELFIHLTCPLFKFHMNNNNLIKLAWKIEDSLKFNANIVNLALRIKNNLQKYNKSNSYSNLYGDVLLDKDAAMFDGRSNNDINILNDSHSTFMVLHYRSEDDWKDHCSHWLKLKVNINDNTNTIDNCNSNVYNMDQVLLLQNIPRNSVIYITSNSKPIENSTFYTYIRKQDLLSNIGDSSNSSNSSDEERRKDREYWAAVDFLLAHNADIFIGHSISTFSALLILRRKRSLIRFPLYDFCYNENCINNHYEKKKMKQYRHSIIPLEIGGLPLAPGDLAVADTNNIYNKKPLDWIFTLYLYENMNVNAIQMMQVAVISAQKNTQLNAICMLSYDFDDSVSIELSKDIISWLESRDVKVVLHRMGNWTKYIDRAYEMNSTLKNFHRSPLYANKHLLISTFMRIDIPLLPLLSSEWILYTDIDVLFLQNIDIDDFELSGNNPNPNNNNNNNNIVMVIGTERVPGKMHNTNTNKITANVGVMLLHIDRLRKTYSSFIAAIFNDDNLQNGFIFDEGPADQGAIRHYYNEYTIVQQRSSWNFKPYWKIAPSFRKSLLLSTFTPSSFPPSSPSSLSFEYFKMNMPMILGRGVKIVHWHGPKPWDYQQYKLSNGSYCTRKSFCQLLKHCNINDHGDSCWFWNRLYFHYLSMTS